MELDGIGIQKLISKTFLGCFVIYMKRKVFEASFPLIIIKLFS